MNDITYRSRDENPARRLVETSALLDDESSSLKREHLIASSEVRRLKPLNDDERWLKIPSQDEGDKQRQHNMAKIGIVAPWLVRHLLVVGNRHVEMAAALVIGMHRRDEGAMPVIFALGSASIIVAPVSNTVLTYIANTLFVRSAFLNRNAKHLSRSKRDQALHKE